MNKNFKVKLFTHNDLDGVGCAVVGKVAFENIDIEYCGYNDINEKVFNFLESEDINLYDYIFVTDISVNEEVTAKIDYIVDRNLSINFKLLDHHKTAEWLNIYDWAYVKSEIRLPEGDLILSGTFLFYEHLIKNCFIEQNIALSTFVDIVRQYDTWEWKRLELITPKYLNDIYHMVGIDEFVETYTKIIVTCDKFDFDIVHEKLLKYKRKEIENYISKKIAQVKVIDKVAFIVADNCISELGNKICEKIDCDYVSIFTGNSVSLRSIGDFDVSVIAKEKGGGGHKNASGYKIDKSDDIFKILTTN